MRKPLSPVTNVLRCLLTVLLGVFLVSNQLYAQCGLASFAGPGTPYNPTTSFQNTQPLGGGTYDEFNVVAGNIYSFEFTSINAPVTNNYWDMTVSTSSAIIAYNNSISPIQNSFTHGIGCPQTPAPYTSSTEWYANYTGTVRINVSTWNAGNGCQQWVSGEGSAVLSYKTCPTTPDPGPGNNVWNVDAFATTDINLPAAIIGARYGDYVDNASGTSFLTTNYWAQNSNPSTAPGWTGCQMPNNNFVVRARRLGFPCGAYNVVVNQAVNSILILLNGVQIYSGSNINSGVTVGQYALTNTDLIEIRTNDVCFTAGGIANVSIAPITPLTVRGGTIGGVANNANVCAGSSLGNFTNVTSGTGGTSAYNNSPGITYKWELSTNGGASFSPVPGVTTDFWNSATTIPAGATYVVKRIALDECGNQAPSNTITIIGVPLPNGSISPASQTICPGGSATLTFNFNPGTAPFNIVYTNLLAGGNTPLNNLTNGATTQVSPSNTANYSFTSITDANGCVTTSGFTQNAAVVVTPPISINNITPTPALCHGSSTGSIVVNASGGQPPLSYSVDGGNTFQATNTFNNLAVGNYNIVVKDNLGCTQSGGSVSIGQPSSITESLSKTDASCAGVFDGTITVTASGGVPPYSYAVNGGPTQASNVITGLQTGTYVVDVYDSHNCLDTQSITINPAYTVTLDTLSTTDITCNGQGNGTIVVQLTGGIPAYQYSINGFTFQNTGTFTGLSSSNYIVIGRDSKGCTASFNVDITQPAPLIVTIDSVATVTCANAGNGGIYAHVSGGTPNYVYHWSNGANTANNLNISGGTYNLTVNDANGCTATNGATVVSPAVLSLNIALHNNPFCNNDSSGAILITANGGVAPYAYAWSNGATTQDLDSLAAGIYTATVTDVNGCQNTISQTLVNPPALIASVNSTNVTCAGARDGSASVTAGGGNPPYTYLWSNFQVTSSISGVSGGTYVVIVTDHSGCQLRDSVPVSEPAALLFTANVTNISCFNANDGSITTGVSGGTQPYSYAWSNGSTAANLSSLAGGPITGTVTDANHCQATLSLNIINPLKISPIFVVNNVTCFGDTTGAIHTTVSDGTPGYTYAWNGGATTANLSNLTPGTYIVTITDSRNCNTVDSAVVTSPSPLYTSGILKNVSCHGLCDGYIFTTPYGGTLPYSYQWSSGPSTENVTLLCGGSYYLTVTDANGCQVASLYIIHEPAQLTTTINTNNSLCFGNCNGSVAAVPAGGTTPYQYLWSNFGTDSMQTGLCAGKYTLLLTDSNGCHLSDTVDLTQPAQILLNGSVTNVACSGFNTGAITLNVTGGAGGYTFVWSNGASTQSLTGLTAGTYSVTVTDSHSCSVTATYVVSQGSAIHTTVSLYQPRCAGGNDGFISVAVTGGVVPYTYSWSTTPNQVGATATNLVAGTYILTVTDSINCSATISANLNNPTPITVTTTNANSRCYNNPNGVVIASATGGYPPYNYTLNGVFQTSDTFVGLAPANYVVLVTDADGCQGTGGFVIRATSSVSVSLSVTDQRILTGMETQLSAVAVSDTTITGYIWTPIAIDSVDIFDYRACGGDTSNCSVPYVKPPFTTLFTVKVMNADSCFATDTITVYVDNEPGEFRPTAFTPNGDGLNDRFALTFLGANKIEVTIFNRWGEKMYYNANQSNNLNAADGWDGTAHGKEAPTDTYVYQANVTYFNGVVKKITGTVSLIR